MLVSAMAYGMKRRHAYIRLSFDWFAILDHSGDTLFCQLFLRGRHVAHTDKMRKVRMLNTVVFASHSHEPTRSQAHPDCPKG